VVVEEPDRASADQGPVDSLRALGISMLELMRTRIELAVLEFREEAERRKEMALLAMAAGVFLALGVLLLGLFVVFVFWDDHRLIATAGVTAAYFGSGMYALARLKDRARNAPPPFEATLAELARDVEALRKTHE
jgi:uncharacterized membrane protein YqjE